MAATIIREESFDPADYRGELDAAPENLDVGTRLWFENDHIRVWEVRLMPGERGPTSGPSWTAGSAASAPQTAR